MALQLELGHRRLRRRPARAAFDHQNCTQDQDRDDTDPDSDRAFHRGLPRSSHSMIAVGTLVQELLRTKGNGRLPRWLLPAEGRPDSTYTISASLLSSASISASSA